MGERSKGRVERYADSLDGTGCDFDERAAVDSVCRPDRSVHAFVGKPLVRAREDPCHCRGEVVWAVPRTASRTTR